MPKVIVHPGDEISVSVKLEFEGKIYNHLILVEDKFIPTTNNEAVDFKIKLNGDPFEIEGRFRGEKDQSSVKVFSVTINGHTLSNNDLKITSGELVIICTARYAHFDLSEPEIVPV